MSMPSRPWTRLARVVTATVLCAAGAVALVPSAASAATGALIDDPGCTASSIGLTDDGGSPRSPLTSPVQVRGGTATSFTVYNNGGITLGGGTATANFQAFFADLDSRGTGTATTYGQVVWDGRPALCASWSDIGYYPMGTDLRSDLQALLVDRSDLAPGDFDVIYNYGRIQGSPDEPAHVGYDLDGPRGWESFALPGDFAGVFADTSPTGLVHGSRESSVPGRYVFRFRDGTLATGSDTTITSEVAERSATSSPEFTYSTASPAEEHLRFECRLTESGAQPDGFATCADGGRAYTDLADGTYVFEVRSVDSRLGVDSTPASRTFTVDTTGPTTELDQTPGAVTNVDTPVFTWSSPDADVASYQCLLQRAPASEPTSAFACASGDATTSLGDGRWTFQVSGVDDLGNVGEPATYELTIDTAGPAVALTEKPAASTNDRTPTFAWTSTDVDVDSYECTLDRRGDAAAPWDACTSGHRLVDLRDGDWTFRVRAVDHAGNVGLPATYDFAVDTIAPETAVTSGPPATIAAGEATFAFTSSELPATFECRISGAQAGAWQPCDGGATSYGGLGDGTWTFEVRASDAAGNVDSSPAARTVTVDLDRPSITAAVSSPTPISEFGWYRDTVTITYTCAGNGSPLADVCPAPRQVPRAQQGKVVFRATITTADGDSASVSTRLFIDKGRPDVRIKGFSRARSYSSMPRPRCKASDPRSGLHGCTVSVRKLRRANGDVFVVVRAKATDKAGNVRVVTRRAPFRAA
jgi:hypothetical protein